eukprot:CAMPEP_0201553606 /NCGR_PEP_ID=MMETSP0173_2-20130828/31355_1 /ASSEMBLY_ACC=CAM_ASM_000268 /TAXON_ID=218659 /ORGANISM="Vexillifera sp., Strain DIVA3 564/2" /LENGTH=84 /DNA_ID=CAMNT_0047964511 /DNA_START=1 /DNA_END=251 /DNA_ORIENTATION=+
MHSKSSERSSYYNTQKSDEHINELNNMAKKVMEAAKTFDFTMFTSLIDGFVNSNHEWQPFLSAIAEAFPEKLDQFVEQKKQQWT